ncbi:MAG TPA: YtxH domain-containing protein [Bryobacteraceae bacterium]|nr:YtxH domain-containing protein [Bryobacteraceae bacterium]
MTKDDARNVCLFLTGLSLGAAIGMLYAPISGVEARRKIASGAQATRELYQQGLHLAEEAADMMEEGRRLVRG